jgi:hypothetical protein
MSTSREGRIVASCPGNPGCKCRECYGLREFLADHNLDTRGLPPTRTAPTFDPLASVAVEPPRRARRPRSKQPWVPRPPRSAA